MRPTESGIHRTRLVGQENKTKLSQLHKLLSSVNVTSEDRP